MRNTSSPITLGIVAVFCAVMGFVWFNVATHTRLLQQEIEQAQEAVNRSRQHGTELEHQASDLDRSLKRLQIAIEPPPEVRRRDAALRVIVKLRSQRASQPSLRARTRPPSGKADLFFPELLGDPEYNRAYFLWQRRWVRARRWNQLQDLGLSPEVSEKVISLETEYQMSTRDVQQLTGNFEPSLSKTTGVATRQQREEITNEIRALLGEAYDKYQSKPLSGDDVRDTLRSFKIRLGYTDHPLDPTTESRLGALLKNMTSPNSYSYRTYASAEFLEQTKTLLQPEQWEALRQIQAENDARQKRSKLPKSSELPRLSAKT